MAELICYVSGSQEEFDLIFKEANVRFGRFKSGKWEITIRVPECNFKVSPYRYSRCTTIKGLYNKLKRNKHLIKDYTLAQESNDTVLGKVVILKDGE